MKYKLKACNEIPLTKTRTGKIHVNSQFKRLF